MSYSYDTRKKPAEQAEAREAAQSQTSTLKGGVTGAAAGGEGRPDLPEAMRARMSDTFGDSLTAAREPGEAVRGGFLTGHAPEVRSEHTANAGQGVYSGPVTGAMSAAAPSAATAGPIQAKRKSAEEKQQDRRRRQWIREDEAEKARQQAEGAALAQQRLDAGNTELMHDERTWDEDHWGLGKRLKHWFTSGSIKRLKSSATPVPSSCSSKLSAAAPQAIVPQTAPSTRMSCFPPAASRAASGRRYWRKTGNSASSTMRKLIVSIRCTFFLL